MSTFASGGPIARYFSCGWCGGDSRDHDQAETADCLLLISDQLTMGITPHGWLWAHEGQAK